MTVVINSLQWEIIRKIKKYTVRYHLFTKFSILLLRFRELIHQFSFATHNISRNFGETIIRDSRVREF